MQNISDAERAGLLERLIRQYDHGNISREEYEALKASILASRNNDGVGERRRKAVGWAMMSSVGLLVLAGLVVTSINGSGTGGGVGDALRPTEAEVACERGVRDATGERPRFDHQQTTAITGGYRVYGVATWDAQAVGYICTVTGPSGRHSVTVELNP